MRSVAIVTISDYDNYGNRLQNLATQEVLRRLGYQAETLVNTPFAQPAPTPAARDAASRGRMPRPDLARVRAALTRAAGYPKRKVRGLYRGRRFRAFRRFTTAFIAETDYVVAAGVVPDGIGERYDAFITGSDQVWNPTWGRGAAFDFLTFAPREKRISYAASFGLSHVPEERTADFADWLSGMAAISVREAAGADIVRLLAGREAEVVIDPTLMLTPDEWLAFAHAGRAKPKTPYALAYFLGPIADDDERSIMALAARHQLAPIRLASSSDPRRYTAGPGEFLDYVSSAALVVTDSFHGAAFAILFGKPLIVFPRSGFGPSMDARMETLLTTFDMHSRRWESVARTGDVLTPPPTTSRDVLERERAKALRFLRRSLSMATGPARS